MLKMIEEKSWIDKFDLILKEIEEERENPSKDIIQNETNNNN